MESVRVQSNAEAVLRKIETTAQRRFLPIIGPVKGKYLADVVRKNNTRKVLEVGTLVGYSAILIASNLPVDGTVDTIEINPQSAAVAENNIGKAGLVDKIVIHIGNALEILPGIKGEFDLIFLDAAKTEYMDYLKIAEPLLKKNGILFADNVKIFAADMQDYLEYVRQSKKYSSKYIDVGYDGVEISTKLF